MVRLFPVVNSRSWTLSLPVAGSALPCFIVAVCQRALVSPSVFTACDKDIRARRAVASRARLRVALSQPSSKRNSVALLGGPVAATSVLAAHPQDALVGGSASFFQA